MNNPEAFKEDEVRSIKFVVPGLPFGKQRPKVTVRKFITISHRLPVRKEER